MIFTVTADDTLTLFDRVISDLADDDVSTITFPNDAVKVKTGKNKNTIFSRDETGNNANLVLRLVRGSSDDQFMQTQLQAQNSNFVGVELANGEFVKHLGNGQGQSVRDVYTLLGGVFTRQVDGKENTSGDTEQAVSIYNMTFASAKRNIQ